MSFFENPWWKGKQDLGGLLTGFGQNIVDNLVPFQQGKDGNLMPREGYNPVNPLNIGLLGMQSGAGYVPGKTATGADTEYRGNFADYIGNINKGIQKQLMTTQALKDSLLQRDLVKAKIGQAQRSGMGLKRIQIPGRDKSGNATNRTIVTQGGQIVSDTTDLATGVRTGTQGRPFYERDPKTQQLYKVAIVNTWDPNTKSMSTKRERTPVYNDLAVVNLDGDLSVINKAVLMGMNSSEKKEAYNFNAPQGSNADVNYPGLFQQPSRPGEVVYYPKIPSTEQQMKLVPEYRKKLMEDKQSIFNQSQYTGSLVKAEDGRMRFTNDGIYSKLKKLSKMSDTTGGMGNISEIIKTHIPSLFSRKQKETSRDAIIRLSNLIQVRASELILPEKINLSGKMIDSRAETKWLKTLTQGKNVEGWFGNAVTLRKNVERLERLERYSLRNNIDNLRVIQNQMKGTPWLRPQLLSDKTWLSPAKQYHRPSAFGN